MINITKLLIALYFLLFNLIITTQSYCKTAIPEKIGPLLYKIAYQDTLKKGTTNSKIIKVIVVLNTNGNNTISANHIDELKEQVETLGGYMGNNAFSNVQVWIPATKIIQLSKWSLIRYIRLPVKLDPHNILISEGVDVIGANQWHNNSITGAGVKIGIVDFGFKGYDALMVMVGMNRGLSDFRSQRIKKGDLITHQDVEIKRIILIRKQLEQTS